MLIVIMALMETVGVASIMPFVSVLANPGIVEDNFYLSSVYKFFNFNSVDNFLFFLGIVVFVIFISTLAFRAFTLYAITRFSSMRVHTMACRLLAAYLRQPYEYFLGRNTADMAKSILSEINQVTTKVLMPLMKLIAGVMMAVAILLLLLVVEPMVSIGAAVLLGGFYTIVYVFSRRVLHYIGEDRILANKERFILTSEVLNGIKELKLLGRDNAYMLRFEEPSKRYARHQATVTLISQLPRYAIQAVSLGGVVLMILYLLGRHKDLENALPLIALFAFAGYRLIPAFQEVFGNIAQLRYGLPVLDSLYKDLTAKQEFEKKITNKTNIRLDLSYQITIKDVTYRYPSSEKDALKNLNIIMPRGNSIGFVGRTGAGKSTTVDLILGLLTPTKGQILIDKIPLDSSNMRAWQDKIGYVPQSIYLSDDTVAANIAFGIDADSIDYKAVENAARIAHIHDYINLEMPDGYYTIVGERGVRLSGGQRQRLAIARALYHDPDVIIFDEATSALDNSTEAAIMEAIEELHGTKTIILIAHRLSTVRSCDRIFLLDNGEVKAEGRYQELLTNSLEFRNLAQTVAR